ncbi:DoxX family protein [Nocardia tengchongensis]|uniref:DoxX family protein n=1 Tax=Nocardia tengchongensis TaxID=2055889 RepID=UPI003689445E
MLRRIAHPLLATAFVIDGIDTLINPDLRIKTATVALQKGEQKLPPRMAAHLPADPAHAIRVNAAIRVGAGSLLAIGKLPRLSTAVLAATVVPAAMSEQGFWTEQDPERRAAKRTPLFKDVSLLGALLIASTDRQGKPSLGWRGRRAIGKLHSEAVPDHDRVVQFADAARVHGPELAAALQERGEHLADAARDHGPELVAAVRDRGERLVDAAQHHGGQLARTSREVGVHWGRAGAYRGGQLVDAAREHGSSLAEGAREHTAQLTGTVQEQGAQLATSTRSEGRRLARRAREWGELARAKALRTRRKTS